MNDEGRDGTHAKACLLVQSAGNRCSLVRFISNVTQIQFKVCFAVFLGIGSSCV